MDTVITRYAHLLCHYCLQIRPGDKLFISSTMLAEPLVRAVYQTAYAAGAALVECDLAFRERDRLFFQYASDEALRQPPTLQRLAMESFDCYLNIRAPYNLRESNGATPERAQMRNEAIAPINKNYFERTADRRLRRNLCQYPTDA
ncbi:MAG: aminopeptidase, partial [Saprospiraceae bacterium]|nr:aminopeptidase [Saprospiraceae bacterium]